MDIQTHRGRPGAGAVRRCRLAALTVTLACACPWSIAAAPAAQGPAPSTTGVPVTGTAECDVFRRESGFAATVDRHDAAAFASYLLPGAVFDVGTPAPTRGAAAVRDAWADIISGKAFTLKWRPRFALVGGDPDVAITHGPYLITRTGADGRVEHATGRFSSVWKRLPDGQWYVLFDGGGEPPRAIDAAEARTLFDALPTDCRAPAG